jgi:gamma-glutamylcyclotransferase (GGCT)/AIG2-like uncharacterized protein YtfP
MIVTTHRNVPALFNTRLGKRVAGQVYEVNSECIQALDMIEGTSSGYYYRGKINVTRGALGEELECDTYFKGSGARFNYSCQSNDDCAAERAQINAWFCTGAEFLQLYTNEHHESYYVKGFLPAAMALATKQSEEAVRAAVKALEARLANAASEQEKTEVLSEVWQLLV